MLSRTRLLLLVIFAYAGVLNVFVTHLFMQEHPDLVRSVRRRSASAVSTFLTDLEPLPAHATARATARAKPSETPPADAMLHITLPGVQAALPSPKSSFSRPAPPPSCPPGPPAVVVAVAASTFSPKSSASSTSLKPDMRLLTALRDMLRNFELRVVLLGAADALTPTHRLWCSGGSLPCALVELPPPLAVAADPANPSLLATLTDALLHVSPCLDDVVLLHSALALPALFVRQLQRLTRPGKLTCLARTAKAVQPTPLAPCPALAFRLPRSFLLSSQGASGDVHALAAQRGLLAPAVGLLQVY